MFTWLIEHIIGSIPVWVWTFVAGGGVGAYFLSIFAPKPYSLIIRISGIAAVLFGVFMCGGAGVTSAMQQAMDELKDKVEKSEQQSKDANEALASALKDKKNNTKEVQYVIQERIVHDAAQMDATCKVDPIAIKDLNDAAINLGAKK